MTATIAITRFRDYRSAVVATVCALVVVVGFLAGAHMAVGDVPHRTIVHVGTQPSVALPTTTTFES